MRILLINDIASPAYGSEYQTVLLREALRRRKHDARIFASSASPAGKRSCADYQCFGTTSRLRTLLRTANPWAYWRLRQVLAEFHPDVVHVRLFLTQLSPLILPLLFDWPCIHHVTYYSPICPVGTKFLPTGVECRVRAGTVCYQNRCLSLHHWLLLMVQMALWRKWQHAFELTIANSQSMRERLLADGIRPDAVILNGVPVGAARPPLNTPPTVSFAGRLVGVKGVDVLVNAFSFVVQRMPQARLLVAGDGPEYAKISKLIEDLKIGKNVAMLGHISHTEMEQQFSAAWVHAVPSRWAEPFGNVVLEAMMRGTAVVTSAVGGPAEIVEQGRTGFLVPAGDVQALAASLLTILQDRQLAEQLGQSGRTVAIEQYGQDSFVDEIVTLYQKVLYQTSRTESDVFDNS